MALIYIFRELGGGEMGLARSWDAFLPTWMEVTRDLDGIETQILGPGCNWYGTWMEVRDTPGDIMDGGEMGPARCGNAILGSWVDMGRQQGGGVTQIWGPGWSNMDEGNMRPGWRWHMYLGIWMKVRWDRDGGETHSLRPGLGWDGTWMELRSNKLGLGCSWDACWMEMKCQ